MMLFCCDFALRLRVSECAGFADMDTPPEMFRYLGREDLMWTVSDVSPADLVRGDAVALRYRWFIRLWPL